ncbi:hypothetical protein ACIQI8_08745 [Streptomyces sp. NPDC092369]|uniref:hypothetical protein n=1 Tax=Streptomyces sp. NPDC092369 TaxID=3366015 RepID=UPI00380FBD69
MAGISGTRSGRVHVLTVDDERALIEALSLAVTEAAPRLSPAGDGQTAPRQLSLLLNHPRQALIKAPMIHTVRGTGHTIRPVEEGR